MRVKFRSAVIPDLRCLIGYTDGTFSTFDLAPDCKRLAAFLADDANGEKLPTHLTFLLNFFDELRRRAPAGK